MAAGHSSPAVDAAVAAVHTVPGNYHVAVDFAGILLPAEGKAAAATRRGEGIGAVDRRSNQTYRLTVSGLGVEMSAYCNLKL